MISKKNCVVSVRLHSNEQDAVTLQYKRNESTSMLKKKLQQFTGVPMDDQLLYYSGYLIHDNVIIGELTDCSIIRLNLDVAIRGGANCIEPIVAPDMTSQECFEECSFASEGPNYNCISRGINFGGICRNISCIAFNNNVTIRLKMCTESNNICNYSEYMFELKCPACQCYIEPDQITNVYFMSCTVKIKYKIFQGGRPQEFEMIAPADKYLRLKDAEKKLKYNYIKFTLK